jgi:hypothetical protein
MLCAVSSYGRSWLRAAFLCIVLCACAGSVHSRMLQPTGEAGARLLGHTCESPNGCVIRCAGQTNVTTEVADASSATPSGEKSCSSTRVIRAVKCHLNSRSRTIVGLSWQSGAGTNAGGPTYTARACTGALSRSTDTRSQGFSLRRGHGITGVTVFEDDRGIHTMLFSMSDGKTAVCSALQQQLTWNGPSQSINATAVRGPSSSNSSSSSSSSQYTWRGPASTGRPALAGSLRWGCGDGPRPQLIIQDVCWQGTGGLAAACSDMLDRQPFAQLPDQTWPAYTPGCLIVPCSATSGSSMYCIDAVWAHVSL